MLYICCLFRPQIYEKEIIQTNNLPKNEKIQRNNSAKIEKIQRNILKPACVVAVGVVFLAEVAMKAMFFADTRCLTTN